MEIIDGHNFSVASLDAARVTNVSSAGIAADGDLTFPGVPGVKAQPGSNAIRLSSIAVS